MKSFVEPTEEQAASINEVVDFTKRRFLIGRAGEIYKSGMIKELLKSAPPNGFAKMLGLTLKQIKNWKLGKGDEKTNLIFAMLEIAASAMAANPEKYGLPANTFHVYDFQI